MEYGGQVMYPWTIDMSFNMRIFNTYFYHNCNTRWRMC